MSDAAQTTKRYRVTGIDVWHSGHLIRDGQIIDLTDGEAVQLDQYLTAIDQSDDAPVKPSRKS